MLAKAEREPQSKACHMRPATRCATCLVLTNLTYFVWPAR